MRGLLTNTRRLLNSISHQLCTEIRTLTWKSPETNMQKHCQGPFQVYDARNVISIWMWIAGIQKLNLCLVRQQKSRKVSAHFLRRNATHCHFPHFIARWKKNLTEKRLPSFFLSTMYNSGVLQHNKKVVSTQWVCWTFDYKFLSSHIWNRLSLGVPH